MNIETANKLLELRKKHHFSQEELAEKLGVSRQAVSKWERAEASPDTDNLILLARLYNVSLDELLNIDVKSFRKEKKGKTINLTKPNDTQVDEKTPIIEDTTTSQEKVFNPNSYMVTSMEEAQAIRTIPKMDFNLKKFNFLESIADALETFMINHNLTYKSLYLFPYYAIAILMFFLSGYFIGYQLSWLWFLTIPLYYTTLKCLEKRNLYIFCYPIVCFMIFYLQIYFFRFEISWLWFLTIPLYYTIIPAVKRRNPLIFCYPVVAVMLFIFFGYFISFKLSLIFFATIPFYYWYFSKRV